MSEETKKTMMKIENSEEAECTFVDDETSTDVDQEDIPTVGFQPPHTKFLTFFLKFNFWLF